jgi:hypothetical protein
MLLELAPTRPLPTCQRQQLNRMSYPSPSSALKKLIELLQGNTKLYLCTTGAASGIAELLTSQPGSSKIFLGAEVPYDQTLLGDYTKGISATSAVSRDTALAMANESYLKGQDAVVRSGQLLDGKPRIIGIGVTAAIASGPRRGLDRMHIALRTFEGMQYGHFEFRKGCGGADRKWQNLAVKKITLNAILRIAGIAQLNFDTERVTARTGTASENGITLEPVKVPDLKGDGPFLILPDGTLGDPNSLDASKDIIFPGSFKSFHCGHDAVARAASEKTGKRVIFEISGSNVSKDAVGWNELARRAEQFSGRYAVLLYKSAARFIEKSQNYPKNMEYVVGYDVAERILMPKFYGDQNSTDITARDQALRLLKQNGARFYVIGRAGGNAESVFLTGDDLTVPTEFKELFISLPAQRRDISSTALSKR